MHLRIIACIVVGSFFFPACRKKPEPPPPAKEVAPVAMSEPASPDAPPPPIPAGNNLGKGSSIDLVALNKIFKSYCATLDSGKPRSLGELVAAGYMDKLPEPPKGKKLAIDFKKMEVVLEND